MRKRVTHKQAYKAMKKLSRYCKQTPNICCRSCIFYDGNHPAPADMCILSASGNPLMWTHLSGKQIKKNLAEVSKCET